MRRWKPGRDTRGRPPPGPPGTRRDDGRAHHVAVLGGGIAGLAAATALAERGVAVTLLEAHDQLGGRVRAWPVTHDDGPATMSRGFHAFFRQYYNLRALLRRTDPDAARLTPVEDYPLVSADGAPRLVRRHPAHPAVQPRRPSCLRSPTFTAARPAAHRRRRRAASCSTSTSRARSARTTARARAQFLDRLRFPDAARHLALEVFARSFFADPRDFAAGELVAMFHSYFLGSAEGLLFDVPDDDYDTALWAPLGRYLRGLGVDVRTGVARTGGAARRTDGVTRRRRRRHGARRRRRRRHRPGEPPSGCSARDGALSGPTTRWRQRSRRCAQAPPFAVWRLWLDRPARTERPAFLGTAGFGFVDNISVLERFEAGAAAWAPRTGGSVVELHAYALPPDVVARRRCARRCAPCSTGSTRSSPAPASSPTSTSSQADCPLVGTDAVGRAARTSSRPTRASCWPATACAATSRPR